MFSLVSKGFAYLLLLSAFHFLLVVHISACSWDHLIWQVRDRNADPYFRFIENEKAGYIDRYGKVVIEPTSKIFISGNDGGEFHDGLLLTDLATGPYFDPTGKQVLDTGFDRNWDFSDGLAAAMRDVNENLWGFIDSTGKFVIEPKFQGYPGGYVDSFSNGMAMVQVGKVYGFVDRQGDLVIKPSFTWAARFSDDRARVINGGPCTRDPFENPCDFGEVLGEAAKNQKVPGCKVSYIDKKGSIIRNAQFDGGRDFSEGLAAVNRAGKWGFIDRRGRLVIPYQFAQAGDFSDGLAPVSMNELFSKTKWGYIDTSGQLVIPFKFERAESFSDGLAPVVDKAYSHAVKERWYYINKHGKKAFRDTFVLASPYFSGLAHVKVVSNSSDDESWVIGNYSYIDKRGNPVFNYRRQ